jgi:hypothetical protein
MDSYTLLQDAVSAARQHHMRKIKEDVYDTHEFSTAWSYTLHENLEEIGTDYLSFLQKPMEEFPSSGARSAFLQKLSNPQLNPHASWFDECLTQIPDTCSILEDLSEKMGVSLDTVRKDLETVMTEYKAALVDLFRWDGLITRKLKVLDDTHTILLQISVPLDESALCDEAIRDSALQEAILDYTRDIYDSHRIEKYYDRFCKAYVRVSALRSVVVPFRMASETFHKSSCSICLESEIGTALNPCGHVFCNSCAQKQQSQCYVCRASITSRLKLYMDLV